MGENGNVVSSDAIKIIVAVLGSALTVAVALAALIMATSSYTRQQFGDQLDLTRGQFGEQIEQTRGQFGEQIEQMRRGFGEQIEQTRREFGEQIEQMRRGFGEQIEQMRREFGEQIGLVRQQIDDLREHTDHQIGQIHEELRVIRGELRALGERQAKVEGLLLAAQQPVREPAAGFPRGDQSSASRAGPARSAESDSSSFAR